MLNKLGFRGRWLVYTLDMIRIITKKRAPARGARLIAVLLLGYPVKLLKLVKCMSCIGIGDDWVLLRFMRFNKFNRGIDYIHHTPG